jgi:hypothetical protein
VIPVFDDKVKVLVEDEPPGVNADRLAVADLDRYADLDELGAIQVPEGVGGSD